MIVRPRLESVSPHVSCFRDTCNVYVLHGEGAAVLVDFGDGDVLDELDVPVTDILLTHHHRDQLGGLRRAADAGIRVWAPPLEAHLIDDVDAFWRHRRTINDYDVRDDRFSLLEDVPLSGAVAEYRTTRVGGFDVFALPTPGHTVGSLTYLVDVDQRLHAFSGDLVYADGKVWSLAATQWSYAGTEGQVATIASLAVLAARRPDVILPSHGEPIGEPQGALTRTADRIQELVDLRRNNRWDVREMVENPWDAITPHFLRNRAAFASSYALVSDDGAALLFDFGYDVLTGLTPTTERYARRALLFPIDVLRRDFGVERIEAAVPTHYHDDHVAGLNLLRDVEGTEVWAPANVAPILEAPERYDLPCLWYEAVRVDRTLAVGESFRWHEYDVRVHELPGHTLYAAAFEVEVDGRRILVCGDQQSNDDGRAVLNYQYRNRFRAGDYVRSAELYRAIRPDVLASGHWPPLDVSDELLDRLLEDGRTVERLHHDLLPDEGLGVEGFVARIEPYRARGPLVRLTVELVNPSGRAETVTVRLVVPDDWAAPATQELELAAGATGSVVFEVEAPSSGRVAAEVTAGDRKLGQQAEAHVEVA
jgi:glyoxylase-like metal-dependent hydrolase (beta-lactamase superfamily II)